MENSSHGLGMYLSFRFDPRKPRTLVLAAISAQLY
jgi:hypothetical protein